jgi:oxygen-independent coproporphyrinogen-3 oxidase
MEQDGLITINSESMTVTELGRRFLRNICMVFDRYLEDQVKQNRFSRTV